MSKNYSSWLPRSNNLIGSQIVVWLNQNWSLLALFLVCSFGLLFLAPVFMKIGWEDRDLRSIPSILLSAIKLSQRSFSLFWTKTMYSVSEIQTTWENTITPILLRQLIGNNPMGWKVAWSDRMISMYTIILFLAWLWYPLRKKV